MDRGNGGNGQVLSIKLITAMDPSPDSASARILGGERLELEAQPKLHDARIVSTVQNEETGHIGVGDGLTGGW